MLLVAYVGVAYSISRITFLEFGEMKRGIVSDAIKRVESTWALRPAPQHLWIHSDNVCRPGELLPDIGITLSLRGLRL
jgi:hypothetical protein